MPFCRVRYHGESQRAGRLVELTPGSSGTAALEALAQAGFEVKRWRPLVFDAARGGWAALTESSAVPSSSFDVLLEDVSPSSYWREAQEAARGSSSPSSSGYFGIGVVGGKTAANQGTVWRSAYQLGAAFTFTIGARF